MVLHVPGINSFRQNARHYADDVSKNTFLGKNVKQPIDSNLIEIDPGCPINDKSSLV